MPDSVSQYSVQVGGYRKVNFSHAELADNDWAIAMEMEYP